MLVKFAVTVAFLLASGCMTTNLAGTTDYQRISEDPLLSSVPIVADPQQSARIIAKRDRGFTGSALSSFLLLNGKPIAQIKPGQFLELSLTPGEYLFGVTWSDNLGAIETTNAREIAIDCKPQQTYYLRLFPQPMTGIHIERASQ